MINFNDAKSAGLSKGNRKPMDGNDFSTKSTTHFDDTNSVNEEKNDHKPSKDELINNMRHINRLESSTLSAYVKNNRENKEKLQQNLSLTTIKTVQNHCADKFCIDESSNAKVESNHHNLNGKISSYRTHPREHYNDISDYNDSITHRNCENEVCKAADSKFDYEDGYLS